MENIFPYFIFHWHVVLNEPGHPAMQSMSLYIYWVHQQEREKHSFKPEKHNWKCSY